MLVRYLERGQVVDYKRIDRVRVIFARSFFKSGDMLYFQLNDFDVRAIGTGDILNICERWDGRAGDLQYIGSSCADLWRDQDDGTIYSRDARGGLYVWCPGERLRRHLFRLYQVNDNTVVFVKSSRRL